MNAVKAVPNGTHVADTSRTFLQCYALGWAGTD